MVVFQLLMLLTLCAAGGTDAGLENMKPLRLTYTSGYEGGPAWSPDGGRIAFSYGDRSQPATTICVINADGKQRRCLTDQPYDTVDPAWSPDGNRIAFRSLGQNRTDIWVMNANGSNQVNLTNQTYETTYYPTWSPDGKYILFTARISLDDAFSLWKMDANGDHKTRLTYGFGGGPAEWSPDGSKIACGSDGDIYAMDADGSNPVNLTNHPAHDVDPAWSPDGRRIAFVSNRDGERDIWVMNADGSDPVKVSGAFSYEIPCCPSWSSDGTRLVIEVDMVSANHEIYILSENDTTSTPPPLEWKPDKYEVVEKSFTTPAGTEHEMVFMPAGELLMGLTPAQAQWLREKYLVPLDTFDGEQPAHEVYLDAFYIDKYEVTRAQYKAFLEATVGGELPYGDSDYDAPQKPISMVSWFDAQAYCTWAGLRLPTEAEWEKAARGTDGRIFPWGTERPCSWCGLANYYRDGWGAAGCCGDELPVAVGSRSRPSPYGAYDMAGNVSEWVADWYAADYYIRSPERNPQGPDNGAQRVERGGSAATDTGLTLRATARGLRAPGSLGPGFRCARDVEANTSVKDESWGQVKMQQR